MLLRHLGRLQIVSLALSLGCSLPAPGGAVPRLEGPLPDPSAPPAPTSAPAAAGVPDAASSRLAEPATVRDVEAFLRPEADLCAPVEAPVAEVPSSSVVERPPISATPVAVPSAGNRREHRPVAPSWRRSSPSFGRLPPEVVRRIRLQGARHLANVRACCAATHERTAVKACLREKEPPRDMSDP